jgi:hypothetical protein
MQRNLHQSYKMKKKILISLLFLLFSTALWAQDKATDSDVKACGALAEDGNPPWSVNSAEFVHPPFAASVAVGPRENWKKVTVAVPFCRVIGCAPQKLHAAVFSARFNIPNCLKPQLRFLVGNVARRGGVQSR